ncbi:MAG: hypothetical protein ACYS0H_17250, partial [Planctomycetota bacterium]
YSSASIFTVQDKGDILGAVVFATDRGDTHISLDRIKNATIKAKDLRLRLEFEGATENLKLPAAVQLNEPIEISSAPVTVDFQIPHAAFGDYPLKVETTPSGIDLILYTGPEKPINFAQITEAAIIFALSISTASARADNSQLSIVDNQSEIVADFRRPGKPQMSLAVPTKPKSTKAQRKASKAALGPANPWKTPTR